jgi:hypothetical protein
MAELVHVGARLDLLSLGALTSTRHLSAGIWLAEQDNNDPLRAAARLVGVTIREVSR